jgi:hypothetical protein
VRAGSVDHGRCTVPSHGAQADAAVNAGATAAEIVDVLIGVVPIVCLPYVAAAAPKLATVLRELGLTSDQVWGLTKRRPSVPQPISDSLWFSPGAVFVM